MSTPEVELRSAWQHLVGPHHAQPLDHRLEELLARLREPHRRYHTATHVMWVLRHLDHIDAAGSDPSVDASAVRLAALYHDAVYDPRRADNEAHSADLAVQVATALGWSTDRAATAHRLVLATAEHHPVAPDEAMLVDADLAILGAEPTDYAAYVHGIRSEYAHVSPEQWVTGRAEVLRRFLDAPALFHTEVMHRELESRAKANLTAELASLR
jgi:predicted metal-dependent HD superfamily phosphohydrolase